MADGSTAKIKGYIQRGDWRSAGAMIKSALKANSQDGEALYLQGLLARAQGDYKAAFDSLVASLQIDEHYQPAMLELADMCVTSEHYDIAENYLYKLIELGNQDIKVLKYYAGCKYMQDEYQAAREIYSQTEKMYPSDSSIWVQQAQVCKTLGDYDNACAYFERCTSAPQTVVEGFWGLANLKRYRFSDGQLDVMRSVLRADDLGESRRSLLLFSMARAHEDRDEMDAAVLCYREANALQAKNKNYRPELFEEFVDQQIESYSSASLPKADTDADFCPVFVVGLPRSGSTLTEQILASHSQIEGTRELPYIGRLAYWLEQNQSYPNFDPAAIDADLNDMAKDYLAQAQSHRKTLQPFTIDKHPNNCLHIGLIRQILPNAKIIEIRRSPLDNCVSAYKQYFEHGQEFSYDLGTLGHYYSHYDRLMQHWHRLFGDSILRVDYEALLDEPEEQTRRMLDYVGVGFEEACLEFYANTRSVNTPSAEQVRQPLYKSAVGTWALFADHSAELVEQLGDLASQ